MRLKNILNESTEASDIIKDLDKVRTDLIKKVDVLIAKKKKLYSDVDITTPMSADEKKLDKDIQDIFSQIQQIIQQKRKIKNESMNESTTKKDIEKLTSYKDLFKFFKDNKSKLNKKYIDDIEGEIGALKYLESDYKRGDADREEVLVAIEEIQDLIKKSLDIKESVNEGKYYVTYNKGRGQGKGLEKEFDSRNFIPTNKPIVFNSYNDAKKYAEKMEKIFRNSIGGGTAYWVSDEKMNPIKESVNEEKVYIDFLNKAKGFKQDRIKFNSYEDAVKWARKNFDKFDPDMIKYESINEAGMNPVKKVVNAILKKNGVGAMKTTSTSVKGFHNIQNGGYRYDSDYFLSFYNVPQNIIDKVGAEMEKAGVRGVDVRKGIISADFTKTGLVSEGRGVKSIQSDFNKTVAAIETELLHYKKTKGTPQEKKHVDNLKKLHPIKKKLEAELESAVSGLYRDAELKIED
jgi:hypothetical protein